MKQERRSSLSLLWRILLSTSFAITVLFGVVGWVVQTYAGAVSQQSLQQEVETSLQAYRALWAERIRNLSSISRVISTMSDVRAAFMTRDSATIRDTVGQLWSGESAQGAAFLVLDPIGDVIAALDGPPLGISNSGQLLENARKVFPKQYFGYVVWGDHLYYVVLTPVYVQTNEEPALLNVLLVALEVDDQLAQTMKTSTRGSDFAFVADHKVVASSLGLKHPPALATARHLRGDFWRVKIRGTDSLLLETKLPGLIGSAMPELLVIRSFAEASNAFSDLQKTVAAIWLLTMCAGLAVTYWMAKRILRPMEAFDRAAEQVIQHNYDYRVPEQGGGELARLGATFNAMCDSIKAARQELIARERIETIGRLAVSIVHDLRNPLAAIYGSAEMLVDSEDLSEGQKKRLTLNIYRSSRQIQELLQELLDVTRMRGKPTETHQLAELVHRATDAIARSAQDQNVALAVKVDETAEVVADEDRLVRVLINIMGNSLEAMPRGGTLTITSSRESQSVVVHIEDTGGGISEEIWPKLFTPFSSHGKNNGMGLGLALSRQTVVEHNGELWADRDVTRGARFHIRLPLRAH